MTIKQFIKFFFSHFPKRLPLLIIILVISGLLESVGIGAVIPVFEFFFQGRSFDPNSPISRFFHSFLSALHITPSLPILFSIIIFFFSLRSFLLFTQEWFCHKITAFFFNTQSNALLNSIIQSKWQIIHHKKQGSLLTLFTQELDKYSHLIYVSIYLLSEAILLLFYLLLSFIVSWQITCVFLILLALVSYPLTIYQKYMYKLSNKERLSRDAYTTYLQECISGLKWIKSSGRHSFASQFFRRNVYQKAHDTYLSSCYKSLLPSFFIVFSIISLTSIAYLSLVIFHMTFSYFLLISIIFYRLYPKFQGLQLRYQAIASLLPSLVEIHNQTLYFESNKEQYGTQLFSGFSHAIEFKNVSFCYQKKSHFSLNDFSLSIKNREFLGIVGPSGCGKTTIIDILTGLLPPSSGELLIDSTSLKNFAPDSYRQFLGIVSQDTFLFHDTIYNNLTWGLDNVSKEDVEFACKQAHALELISQLDHQFDTIIGDRGIKLSGGQRQRLSLARALLKKPSILILDEATSALDAESEHHIHQSIKKLKGSLTLVVISHRLASVKFSDRIIVMDHGHIIEEGTWSSLSKNKGKFNRFRDLQILD
ncbi:hypothetical protein DID78_05245 [Candidatus Marinamargulisbacteria bacterium SCGC AG-343-D04]|nr:hypothetical protein DID78_05245 [Candidatus Marinamargulisbacteria bacterium SCGC AG-343-D04]